VGQVALHSKIQTGRFSAEYSTFGIGGPVRFLVEVRTVEEAAQAFEWAREQHLPALVIGKGSNTLFEDAPFEGLLIVNRIDFCSIEGNEVTVGAGYSFSLLGVQTARKGLSGLEFASGIPATVGGAIFMNAGANGQETATSLTQVSYLEPSGKIQKWQRQELLFGYRASSFQGWKGCILEAKFLLKPKVEARKEQLRILEHRIQTQPYKDKSAGCVFRNPAAGVSAGALIDQSGLKGFSVGGAQVSEVHANFLINAGGAKAADMRKLIQEVQQKVYEKTGYRLEPEIRMLP
jgi:UDP-N-acetylmuramate dehydrogenase